MLLECRHTETVTTVFDVTEDDTPSSQPYRRVDELLMDKQVWNESVFK